MKILFLLQIILFFLVFNINSTFLMGTKKSPSTTKKQEKGSKPTTLQQKIKRFSPFKKKEQSIDTQIDENQRKIDDNEEKLKSTKLKVKILSGNEQININMIRENKKALKKIRIKIKDIKIKRPDKEFKELREQTEKLELEIKAKTEILEQSKKGHPFEQQKGELETERNILNKESKTLEERQHELFLAKEQNNPEGGGGEKGSFFTGVKDTVTDHAKEIIGGAITTAVVGLTAGAGGGGIAGIAAATSDDEEGGEGGAEYEEYIDDVEVDIGVYETVPRLRKKITSGLAAGTSYLNDDEE